MNKQDLVEAFDRMKPGEFQKERMLEHILSPQKPHAQQARRFFWRWPVGIALPTVCLVLALTLFMPFGGGESWAYGIHVIEKDGAVFRLADNQKRSEDYGISVSNVDPRPGLEFFIEGQDIAKIEITTKNEYIYAKDWTQTQDEKYWNSNLYQYFDEERQVSVADFSKLYDKQLTMTFDEDFGQYDQIWYRWTAWNLYKWAAADNYSHFLGYGIKPDKLSEEDKMGLAAGNDGSGIGHIQLDGYPEQLTEDTITIKITDRRGNSTTKAIHVKVRNNESRETVVTATLRDK
ncbi:MAG: hypothetical protein K0R57_451 [Paenibacillaceae bacterium]|nr:hypothetical protein [Paenibacillaceae bacterium]